MAKTTETARQLRVIAVLQMTQVQFLEPKSGASELPLIPVQGERAPSSVLLGACSPAHVRSHSQLKKLYMFSKRIQSTLQ